MAIHDTETPTLPFEMDFCFSYTLNSEEVQEVEQQALARLGMSSLVLLQRAGHAVAQFCAAHFKFRTVCVVCGAGKNGARGLAAAESLCQVAENVSVILLASSADALEPTLVGE
jgi:NAD(P)H-hydrate repair Nnr-like enzyme with NAD(P)H-hydrate epimerase domain